jgi:hypothetical protein
MPASQREQHMSDIKTIVHLGNKNAPNLPLPPDKMNIIYWDDTDTGFGRRLWRDRKGRVHAAWIIQYRTHSGIQRRMTFARGNLPAHKARKLAIEQLARTKFGSDPQGDKAIKRQALAPVQGRGRGFYQARGKQRPQVRATMADRDSEAISPRLFQLLQTASPDAA